MKLGAEPKKVAILGGLVVVAAVSFYLNGSAEETPVAPVRPAGSGVPAVAAPAATPAARPRPRNVRIPEFRPSLKGTPGTPIDWSKADPSLREDLLAKLQTVSLAGSGRNLFEFSAAPPPVAPPPPASAKPDPKIIPGPIGGPSPDAVASNLPPPEPPKPIAPPIPLKFYGYISAPKGGQRRGFFLDGEEIVVAGEGDVIKRRYKVVQIRLSGVEMEDTQFSQRQTLRLEDPAS
jgi:hypothetical protein